MFLLYCQSRGARRRRSGGGGGVVLLLPVGGSTAGHEFACGDGCDEQGEALVSWWALVCAGGASGLGMGRVCFFDAAIHCVGCKTQFVRWSERRKQLSFLSTKWRQGTTQVPLSCFRRNSQWRSECPKADSTRRASQTGDSASCVGVEDCNLLSYCPELLFLRAS